MFSLVGVLTVYCVVMNNLAVIIQCWSYGVMLQVPLGLIEGIEMQTNKETVTVLCRDARIFRYYFVQWNEANLLIIY